MNDAVELLDDTLATGSDRTLRGWLQAGSGLPGPRLDLRLVDAFADAAGTVAGRPEPPVEALELLLDGWAALGPDQAPGDQPAVILPCAALAAYGAVGVARPEWAEDELGKLHRAAGDVRWRVREVVAQALQRLLEADWPRFLPVLGEWSGDDDPLVVRAAAAAVAEPRLLGPPERAKQAQGVQRLAVARYRTDPHPRKSEPSRVLRQALAFTISVTVAATADFDLLDELVASDDPDLRWIAAQNLKKARLGRWPEQVERLRRELASE